MSGWLDWLLAPVRFLANLPRNVSGMSLPARIAASVGVFQVVVVLLALGVLLVGDERQVFQAWWRPGKLAVLAILLVLTPALVYQAARLWLERDVSRWPDILEAWQAGLTELRMQGLSLSDIPLFLVIGAASDEQETAVLGEAACEFPVRAAPAGAAAMHFYGGPDAVFVCIANACQTSDAARRGVVVHGGGPGRAASSAAPAAHEDGVRGTVALALPGEPAAPAAMTEAAVSGDQSIGIVGTIQIDAVTAAVGATAAMVQPAVSADREALLQRLHYVCELIRAERGGLAPINGVLALLPWPVIRGGPQQASAFGRALSEDLAGLREGLGLRAPVMALVCGLEHEPGFVELISRMSPAERQGRLGQRFPVGLAASYEQLGSVASRACGMIEDLVLFRLLRAQDVLARAAGNSQLVSMMVRLRSEVAVRLGVILRRAFAALDGETTDSAPFLSGCYLAASGKDADHRAFVRGVIEKVLDGEGDLAWTEEAESEDRVAARAAAVLGILSGVVFVAIGGLLCWKFFT